MLTLILLNSSFMMDDFQVSLTFKHFNLGPGLLFSVLLLPRKILQSAVRLSPFSLAPNEEGRLWQEIT